MPYGLQHAMMLHAMTPSHLAIPPMPLVAPCLDALQHIKQAYELLIDGERVCRACGWRRGARIILAACGGTQLCPAHWEHINWACHCPCANAKHAVVLTRCMQRSSQ